MTNTDILSFLCVNRNLNRSKHTTISPSITMMKKFEFSSTSEQATTFTGYAFYHVYKDSEFLRHSENIETILAKGYELRKMLKGIKPGDSVMVGNMKLASNTPLLVKNTAGPNIEVQDYEFTNNRLTGLVAAYAFENRLRFPSITSTEAASLGLVWDNGNTDKCRLYLSFVTGAEHFYEQFTYWPLICALRKLQLKKITPELVVKMARKKNNAGERLGKEFLRNIGQVKQIWTEFPGTKVADMVSFFAILPPQVKRAFEDV